MKIVGIGGTLRDGSSTERLVAAVLAACASMGAQTQMFGGSALKALPHFNPESTERTEGERALVEAVRTADAVVIGSPGYHGGVSGLVKNAIDLLEDLARDARPYFDGRPVGLVVSAAGWQATGVTLAALRGITHAMRGWPTPLGIAVNTVAQSRSAPMACGRRRDCRRRGHAGAPDHAIRQGTGGQGDGSMTLSLTDAARLTAGATMWTTGAVPEQNARSLMLADGPMGVASGRVDERDVSVLTPAPVAQGASWDLDLVAQMGALVGNDAIAMGVDALLAPNVNMARSPLAGRAFEYYSEDPLLTGLCGAAWVRGIQATGTAAVAKHFVCNDSETQRDTMNAVIDEATLRQVYLLPFEMACAAAVAGS
jgi:NAD(P)H-dependent FMN reductase